MKMWNKEGAGRIRCLGVVSSSANTGHKWHWKSSITCQSDRALPGLQFGVLNNWNDGELCQWKRINCVSEDAPTQHKYTHTHTHPRAAVGIGLPTESGVCVSEPCPLLATGLWDPGPPSPPFLSFFSFSSPLSPFSLSFYLPPLSVRRFSKAPSFRGYLVVCYNHPQPIPAKLNG